MPEGSSTRTPELPNGGYACLALGVFLVLAVCCVKLTGLRFLLFPPLAVLGFEMFSHPRTCAWGRRPLLMPLACFLTAGGGYLFWRLGGLHPLTAAASMAWGFLVLYILKLHVPPAMAVALIPMIMTRPTAAFPVAVALGTVLLTICYLLYRWLLRSSRVRRQEADRTLLVFVPRVQEVRDTENDARMALTRISEVSTKKVEL